MNLMQNRRCRYVQVQRQRHYEIAGETKYNGTGGVIRDIMTANGIPKESIGDKLFMMGINIVQYGVILLAKYRREDKATRHHEETKPVNENYREGIRKMIEQTEDTHALCCTYTIIKTHLMILAEKGGAI
ncbi:MAG: hypothetical protein K2K74_15560 [Lachnospiraceae bacterium]|nr:hypothetical protein [Lachnospiraceae bacterium]